MKNTLSDLSNHLFAQLEKLGDEELTGEDLDKEIDRAKAMSNIAERIIRTGELQFRAIQYMDEVGYERPKEIPEILEVRERRSK